MEIVADQEERLDRLLARRFPEHSRTKWASWIDAGNVRVSGTVAQVRLKPRLGEIIEFQHPEQTPAHDLTPADIEIEILFEDDELLVANKPRGMATHPAPTLHEPSLVNALLARGHGLSSVGEAFRPGIVHRLDKETTGVILVAKTDGAHRDLSAQIASKSASRTYLAVCAGKPDQETFEVDAPLGRDRTNRLKMAVDPNGKAAQSRFELLATLDAGSLMRVDLRTGRTHQIRVHASSIGHPVLGDRVYAPKRIAEGRPLQLHAWRIGFVHPRSRVRLEVVAPPPEDFLGWSWIAQHRELD